MATELRNLIEADWNNPGFGGETANAVERWLLTASSEAGAAGVVGEAADAGVAVAAVASALSVLEMIGILIALVVVLLLANLIIVTVANQLRRVPWAGDTMANTLIAAFAFLTLQRDSSVRMIYSYEVKLWRACTTFVGYFYDRYVITNHINVVLPTVPSTNQISRSIHFIQSEIDTLKNEVSTLVGQSVHSAGSAVASDVVGLPQQVHNLQSEVQTLYQNQIDAYRELQTIVADLNGMRNTVNSLITNVVGLRTVETGWQDIVAQIEQLVNTSREVNAKQDAAISSMTHTLAELSPLTLLLQPGLPGLRNLRKLEDDPCQCPKFGGLGGDAGTALALYEFITHG